MPAQKIGRAVTFRTLGHLEALADGEVIPLGGIRRRTLLAVLLAHRNQAVSVDTLVDEIWEGAPPPESRNTLQSHVAHLRRALAGGQPDVTIESQAPGYALHATNERLDAFQFEALSEAGRGALRSGDHIGASDQLSLAIALWTGTPMGGVHNVPSVAAERLRLEHLHNDTVEDWADAQLELGTPAIAVPVLEALLIDDPWRERATGHLMLALYRSGRQVEALAAYERLRRSLADDLGLTPSPELRRIERDLLRHTASSGPLHRAVGATPPHATPRSNEVLPFVGRQAELTSLVTALSRVMRGEHVVALVRGEPGAGKSRLVHELTLSSAARGVTIVSGRCDEEAVAPYAVFLRAIGGYVDRVGLGALKALPLADRAELAARDSATRG